MSIAIWCRYENISSDYIAIKGFRVIDIGFLKGAQMEDEFGLLTGSGKVMRVLPLTPIKKTQIEYYINQDIKINSARK